MKKHFKAILLMVTIVATSNYAFGLSEAFKSNIYNPGQLKPIDSILKVKIGEKAPDFTLPAMSGKEISLHQFKGKKHVVISFVPAAWTPVCSDQWPGYNIVKDIFEQTNQMGNLWFNVLSDFWPHGEVANRFGVLRSDGVSERALFVIDKEGIVRYAHVSDINKRPNLQDLIKELEKLGIK